MSEIKPITDHGQETALYRCDQCKNWKAHILSN